MIRAYVFPISLFGVESWTLTEAAFKYLKIFRDVTVQEGAKSKIGGKDHERGGA